MAIRTQSLPTTLREDGIPSAARLAALPTGTIVAVFDSRVDAVGTAVQLACENPEGSVWLASGAQAAMKIRAARAARSFIHRLFSGLSDDEAFVRDVLADAGRDKTVLVVQPSECRATIEKLAGARRVVEFGRWTTRPIR